MLWEKNINANVKYPWGEETTDKGVEGKNVVGPKAQASRLFQTNNPYINNLCLEVCMVMI